MHTLIVHEAFLNSTVIPRECIFTGRTDNIQLSVHFLRGDAPSPINEKRKEFCSFPVLLPHATGTFLRWRILTGMAQFLTILGILIGLVAGFMLLIFIFQGRKDPQNYPIAVAMFLGCLVYAAVTWSLRWYCRTRLTNVGIQSTNSLIYLRFPQARAETARHFLEAYNRFLAAHNVAPVSLLSDEEDWDEAVAGDWDQIPPSGQR